MADSGLFDRAWQAFSDMVMPEPEAAPSQAAPSAAPTAPTETGPKAAPTKDFNYTVLTLANAAEDQGAAMTSPAHQAQAANIDISDRDGEIVVSVSNGAQSQEFTLASQNPGIDMREMVEHTVGVMARDSLQGLRDPVGFIMAQNQHPLFQFGDGLVPPGDVLDLDAEQRQTHDQQHSFHKAMKGAKDLSGLTASLNKAVQQGAGIGQDVAAGEQIDAGNQAMAPGMAGKSQGIV